MLKVSMHLRAVVMQVSHLSIQNYFSAFTKYLIKYINSTFLLFSSPCSFSLQLGTL